MQLSKTVFTAIIVLVVAFSLGSLAYPSIAVPVYSTQTLVSNSTVTNVQTSVYTQTVVTSVFVPYLTATVSYYTAYFLCDPASMACPGPPIFTTTTYSESSPSLYPIVVTSQVSQTYTTPFSTLSTQTGSQNIAAYSALGVSGLQFSVLAALVIIVVAIALFLVLKRNPRILSKAASASTPPSTCMKCGAELEPDAKFCENCGAPR